MAITKIISITSALALSASVNAAIVSADWINSGDNLITIDTTSGLEWLNLTATTNRSYNDISSKFGAGQEFDGWRYATAVEVSGYFDAFGGDNAYYAGWSTQNNGLFDAVSLFWGDTYCAYLGCATGDGYSYFIYDTPPTNPQQMQTGQIYDSIDHFLSPTQDAVALSAGYADKVEPQIIVGSALVRTSVVPIPAAAWLFGSGLIGLIGVARRKKQA